MCLEPKPNVKLPLTKMNELIKMKISYLLILKNKHRTMSIPTLSFLFTVEAIKLMMARQGKANAIVL